MNSDSRPTPLEKLAEAYANAAAAFDGGAGALDAWNRDWARWKMEFCTTASDEEIAEADRLFGTSALTELAAQVRAE